MKTETVVGYVATIAHRSGNGFSYLGRDEMSGGCPIFSRIPEIRSTITQAVKDRAVFQGMKTYYGADKHDFSKTAVCEVTIKEIAGADIEKAYEESVLEKAKNALSPQELEILKRVL